MQPYDYIEIRLPAKAQYIGVARLTISGLASRLGFSYDEIEDLKIAASEAVTNAVQHAYDDREGGLGLYLMETLMDEVKIHHKEGVTVFLTKYVGGKRVGQDAETVSS